jgi:porphobilinogen synthase
MKGQEYLSLNEAVNACRKVITLGIPAVMIFGVINVKDVDCSVALGSNAFHRQVFKKLKTAFGEDLVLISNVCLCDYTKAEFCIFSENGKELHAKTAEMLGKISVAHAEAGADVVAPAAMCDGQVKTMRQALDDAGFSEVPIMSYVKTDSCLFQPFKKAMTSSDSFQSVDSSKSRVDIINDKMFMQKVALDVNEGADIVIVKPALTNLDLILRIKQQYPTLPIAAYQVSGEYAMTRSAIKDGLLSEEAIIVELLSSIKRAGADMILTYFAPQAAKMLKQKSISKDPASLV